MFESNRDKPITAYVNAPSNVYSFKETCTRGSCKTEILFIGLDHYVEYEEDVEVRFIFENDSASDQIFQIAYIDGTYDLIWGAASPSIIISALAYVCLCLAALV